MRLTAEQRRLVRELLASDSHSFVELTCAAGLEPARDFHAADLRGIDFGTDDLAGFNFTGAHFEGADLTRARGLDRAKFDHASWDAATRGLVIRDFPGGPQMVLLQAGSFVMGVPPEESERENSSVDDNARPQHPVNIRQPFYLGRCPVTRLQFAAFVKAEKYDKAGADWRKPGFRQSGEHPVVNVSHDDAEAYVAWLGRKTGRVYRLASEAEWEYAARAGTTTAWFWGDTWDETHAYAHVEARQTVPVGSLKPNGFGLYDMLGNVWEWVADRWHDSYNGAPEDGSAWTTGDSGRRVLRGGSWNGDPRDLRAGCRYWSDSGRPGRRRRFPPGQNSVASCILYNIEYSLPL